MIYSSKDNDDINCSECHLNYYFYTLAGIQIVGMIIFVIVDYKCKIVKLKDDSNRNMTLEVEPLLGNDSNLLNSNSDTIRTRNYGATSNNNNNNTNQISSNSNNQNYPVNS